MCCFGKLLDYIPFASVNTGTHEKELPDLIRCAIDDGEVVKLFDIYGTYSKINCPEEWPVTESSRSAGTGCADAIPPDGKQT